MSPFRRSAVFGLISLILAMGMCWILSGIPVRAQVDTAGLSAVGTSAGLSAADPRVIAARIINISLGFLGVIMVVIILYAGFLWMTSGGEGEKVEKAQKYIRNAVIGLIIILSSWAIATYVINKLLSATQGDGGGISSGGPTGGFGGIGGAGSTSFQVRSFSPTGSEPIRNVVVRILFSRDVDPTTASANIHVLQGATPVAGSLTVSGTLVSFTPAATCPPPNADRHCFDGDTDFTVQVTTGLRSSTGQTLVCGGFAPACTAAFHTGNLIDVTAPSVSINSPFDGQGVSVNDLIPVTTHAADDSAVALIESYDGTHLIGRDSPVSSSIMSVFDGTVYWDTTGMATGSLHTLTSRAFDIDSNASTSTPVTVIARAAHCFNEVQDADETGLNCGGLDCGVCSGGACTVSTDCSSGVCRGGVCVEQPIITGVSPGDGRPGTFVSIQGVNFGSTPGTVTLGGVPAHAPAACVTAGATTWTSNQVIIEVPVGASTGPIRLDNASTSLFDVTNDSRGPRLDDFVVNSVSRPGLCGAVPDHGQVSSVVNFPGANLGSSASQFFFNDRPITSFLDWTESNIRINAPIWQPALYAARVSSTGMYSNAVNFRIDEHVQEAAPVIYSIDPPAGPIGEYVTIHGENFGDQPGTVSLRNASGQGFADFSFPAQCGTAYWRNDTIVFKVPPTIAAPGGLTQVPVTPGPFQVWMRRLSDRAESSSTAFTVNTATPDPGLCAIEPMAGPVNTGVHVYGDRLGSSGVLNFARDGGGQVAAVLDPGGWTNNQIAARVPSGAISGFVNAKVSAAGGGMLNSNSLSFQVSSCQQDAAICRGTQVCCASGACSDDSGVCPPVAVNTHYAWRTSTGIIPLNPKVVEECDAVLVPSPSPWITRTNGDRACLNADVLARFNTRLDPASVTAPGHFVVKKCTGTGADPCTSTVIVPPRSGFPIVRPTALNEPTQYVRFRPATTWDASSTYLVTLTTGITSAPELGSLPMLEMRDRCGAGNGYCFRFATRGASDPCVVGSVTVDPNPYTALDLGEIIDYTASPRPADDICSELDGSSMPWHWSVSDGRASITHTVNAGGTGELDEQNAMALAETGHLPVAVVADLLNPGLPTVSGNASLFINLVPPRVEAEGPNCDTACVNALLWVRFNVGMDLSSFTSTAGSNVILKECTNESCREFSNIYEIDDLALTVAPGDTGQALRYLTGQTLHQLSGVDTYDLEAGKYYKAILRSGRVSGIRSASQLPLTGLNDPDGFAWTFRVKTGEDAVCSVDTVTVLPAEKYEQVIGARQAFVGQPMGSPDACNPAGQPLVSNQSYTWTSSLPNVADYFFGGHLDTTSHLTPRCNGQCLNMGSNGAVGKVADCGDGIVETTDSNYCGAATACSGVSSAHPACVRPDGLPCHAGDTGCVERHTRFNDWCIVLPHDAIGGEECDLGTGHNSPTALCSTSCLWNPQQPITAGTTGRTCGNGVVDRGEQCDPGQTCTAGTNIGSSCHADSDCGTGGACTVADRNGCSASCQALGASSAHSTCGNGDVADGETCDVPGLTMPGHGCSADCLHEGSQPVTSICGNGILEPGESCERTGSAWPVAGCDPVTCLHTGTDACTHPSDTLCCGNGTVDPGEDCDDGEGCTSRCLLAGSSPTYSTPSFCGNGLPLETGEQCEAPVNGDGHVDQRQLAYIVGNATPDPGTGRMRSTLQATYDTKSGDATYGLQCGYTEESSCPVGTGLTDNGCCAPRPVLSNSYPINGATGVCRNVLISGTFPMAMDADSFSTNFLVAEESTTTQCNAGSQSIDTVPFAYHGWFAWVQEIWTHLLAFFHADSALAGLIGGPHAWCVGGVAGTPEVHPDGTGTTASFDLQNALKANTTYHVIFRGDPNLAAAIASRAHLDHRLGIKTSLGVLALPDPAYDLSGRLSWTFTTGASICAVSQVSLRDTTRAHPFLFTQSGEQHQFAGTVQSVHNGAVVPLSRIAEYDWRWDSWTSAQPTILAITNGTSQAGESLSYATDTAQNLNGSSLVNARIEITHDDVQIPSTVGQTIDASHNATVLLCERPWPNMTLAPFTDMSGSASMAAFTPSISSGPYYNFSTLYCMDAGDAGAAGDLPALQIHATPVSAGDQAHGVLRQYLFTYQEDALRQDGIGIRIVSNPLHLSAMSWYRANGFTGTPTSITVDGYDAVRDGSTVYVGTVNTDNASAGSVRSVIFVISHNPDATATTTNIFNQLVSNTAFNINIQGSSNVCEDHANAYYHRTDGSAVHCTADWECLQIADGLHCDSFKPKIQRDTRRIADFQDMTNTLEQYAGAHGGTYPALDSGTYLQSLVTSRWASWQSTFGSALGSGVLPIDPVNRFVTCGRCRNGAQLGNACTDSSDCPTGGTCESTVSQTDSTRNGFDPATCWSDTSHQFMCPIADSTDRSSVSRFYQYRSVDGGHRYELGTELEIPTDRYQPALTQEIMRCTNSNIICLHDSDCTVTDPTGHDVSHGTCRATGGRWLYTNVCSGDVYGAGGVCGNGVINTGETCELGDTLPVPCTTADGHQGTKLQVCSDCHAFIDGPASVCVADSLCGNGRIDNYRCYGGGGYRYGQACTTPTLTATSAECSDPRDPAGVTMKCLPVPTGQVETCDDGAQNGTYGHCNATCTGLTGVCGDGVVSGGELCDNGSPSLTPGHPSNGDYCGLPGLASCSLQDSCSYDCRSRGPHCGDGVIQPPEQCDGNAQATSSALCVGGTNAERSCVTSSDCPGGGTCGGDAIHNACTTPVGRCAGNGSICNNDSPHTACTTDADCPHAQAGSCEPLSQVVCTLPSSPAGQAAADATCAVHDLAGHLIGQGVCTSYPTQHSRSCGSVGSASQCLWNTWSTCQPVGRCGDGHVDPGEECDDGNTSNNDACTNACKRNVCGDGFMQTGVEECDAGALNGTTAVADYGSTVISCSMACRQIPSSGGYCGDHIRNGSEQCDGDATVAPGLTCQALGYDFSTNIKCAHPAVVYHSTNDAIVPAGLNACCMADGEFGQPGLFGETCTRTYTDAGNTALQGTDCVSLPATTTPAVLPQELRSICTGAISDILSCSSTCGYSGCSRCQDEVGSGGIDGTVYDAVYSNQPVPNARVTLSEAGRRVSETFTDLNGHFSFNNLSTLPECATYRIAVDSYVDNPCTGTAHRPTGSNVCANQTWPATVPDVDESQNGGYWSYESDPFDAAHFGTAGVHNGAGSSGVIYLAPKVAQGETLVVLNWNGDFPNGRRLDPHLIMPYSMRNLWDGSSYVLCTPSDDPTRCAQEIDPGLQTSLDLDLVPHAKLICDPTQLEVVRVGSLCSVTHAPETLRYRRNALTGDYAFYIVDSNPCLAGVAGGSVVMTTANYLHALDASVSVITHDNAPYIVRPPAASPACTGATVCAGGTSIGTTGKYWMVYTQDALSGDVSIPALGHGTLQCTGGAIDARIAQDPTISSSIVLPGPMRNTGTP